MDNEKTETYGLANCVHSFEGVRQKTFHGVSGDAKIRDWREVCGDVLRETSQERLEGLLQELLDALDKKEQLEKPTNPCKV